MCIYHSDCLLGATPPPLLRGMLCHGGQGSRGSWWYTTTRRPCSAGSAERARPPTRAAPSGCRAAWRWSCAWCPQSAAARPPTRRHALRHCEVGGQGSSISKLCAASRSLSRSAPSRGAGASLSCVDAGGRGPGGCWPRVCGIFLMARARRHAHRRVSPAQLSVDHACRGISHAALVP